MEVNKKYARTTLGQLEAYIDFVGEHPEFLVGKNTPEAPQRMQELWQELSGRLNSLIGPTRTAAVWKENLRNWRKQLKAKARKVRAENQRTGGGVSSAAALTAFEERALQALGTVCITGLSGADLGFGGESAVQLPCESPIQILNIQNLEYPEFESLIMSGASPSPPPLHLYAQTAPVPMLNVPIAAEFSSTPAADNSAAPAAVTSTAATPAGAPSASATPAAAPKRRRIHRKTTSGLPIYLEEETLLRREEMALRREEMALRREEMEMRREEHRQLCGAITVLAAAVTNLNSLLSAQGGG